MRDEGIEVGVPADIGGTVGARDVEGEGDRPLEAHLPGRELQTAVKAWRTKYFVFLEDPKVPLTNNACEREIRPSVVFRTVTGGFRSDWGAQIHAGYRSVTGTARLHGQTALQSIGQLLAGAFSSSPAT